MHMVLFHLASWLLSSQPNLVIYNLENLNLSFLICANVKVYLVATDRPAIMDYAIIAMVKAANQDTLLIFGVWFPVSVLSLHINFKTMFSRCAFLYLKCGCIAGRASEVRS